MRFQKGHQLNKGRIPWNRGKKGLHIGGRKRTGKNLTCEGCGISFYRPLSRIVDYGNYHSPECFKEYRKRHISFPWTPDVYKKNSGKNNHNFKDIMVSESALHKWVNYHKGRPFRCVDCGVTANEVILEWSNQSGLYFRDLNDFVGRCQPCHKAHDTKLGFPRKHSFDEKGHRIGITIIIPAEFVEFRRKKIARII